MFFEATPVKWYEHKNYLLNNFIIFVYYLKSFFSACNIIIRSLIKTIFQATFWWVYQKYLKNNVIYVPALAPSSKICNNWYERLCHLYTNKIQWYYMIHYKNGILILYHLMGDEHIYESSPPSNIGVCLVLNHSFNIFGSITKSRVDIIDHI